MNYFSDLNRYIAYAKSNTIANGIKTSPSWVPNLTSCKALIETNVSIAKYRMFCMVLRPNTHSLIFFKVQNIIRLLVVNFQFFWGTASDDGGLNSIRPIGALLDVPIIVNTSLTKSINHLGYKK